VELIDSLEAHATCAGRSGRPQRVLVALLPRGEKLLEQVARERIGELRSSGRGAGECHQRVAGNWPPVASKKQTRIFQAKQERGRE